MTTAERITVGKAIVEKGFVPADAEIISDNEILLSKDGKRMRLKMTPGGGLNAVKAHIWSNDPPHDYDAPNPGTCRVGFVFTVPAHSDVTASIISYI